MADEETKPANTIHINGEEYPFEPGQTVIQVAHANGIDVPHYCYHPGLSIAGNCRICMVEVEGNPRPGVSCKMGCYPGLRVQTESELAKAARQGVMEMLLVNHPLDCPICDQAGECHLQDYSYEHGQGRSRSTTPKTHLPKNVPFGANVVYDAERCIKCTLCVRFCDEIGGHNELAMGRRSDNEMVIMTSKGEFVTPYSMNIIDICPVGALTSRDFRFQSRLWFMDFAETISTYDAKGCNVITGGRGNRLMRIEPRENQAVNQWWLPDAARMDYEWVNSETCLATPLVRDANGAWQVSPWETAIEAAGRALAGAKGDVLVDGSATLEEMFSLQGLAEAMGGSVRFAAPVTKDGDGFLLVDEKGANAKGAAALGIDRQEEPAAASLLVVERDRNVPQALRDGTGAVVVFATDAKHVPESAQVAFPFGSFAERAGSLMNIDGIVQQLRPNPQVGPGNLQAAVELFEEIRFELDRDHVSRACDDLLEEIADLAAFEGVDLGTASAKALATSGKGR